MSDFSRAPSTDAVHRGHKTLSTAMLLAVFLGPFGAHRFYMGQRGTATMMLMLAVTLVGLVVTALWLLIDLPRLPAMVRRHNAALERRRALERRSEAHGFPALS
ncbi:TM2 domain-containing protein [Limimaricola litoreus]|uniref:TM2 domain-containing protein n=1 Tax=Limimaricola litoreus TaxID=2955316 RepID=A0A9X2JPE2_9RHOB|nr:TM2 domain-containing protein [Limimaricola litoreus]MCP1169483.1 TM2 domain-containing protein [Limimaricola litoreus]